MRRGFGTWPVERPVSMDQELQATLKRRLKPRLIYLTVTLCRMAVTNFEQSALDPYGDIERRPCHEFFQIHVARMTAGRHAAHAA